MLFFKKKKKEEIEESGEPEGEDKPEPAKKDNTVSSNSADFYRVKADVDKLKAQFSSFYEMQKTVSERFSRINEQIGELRSMMINRDKDSQHLEAKATQAIDLVKTVQPDKLMIELRKGDSKIEALRANIESNESVMKNIMEELKEMRNKMNLFKGIEQVINLNEEVKKELMDTKKTEAVIERHADKVETIFSELQKRFSDFEKTKSIVDDLNKAYKQLASEMDSMKIKIATLATKKEMEELISKSEDFEKHVSNVFVLANKKFEKFQKDMEIEMEEKFEKSEKLLKGFEVLAKKTPDLDKYFNLLEREAKKSPEDIKVEKIKELGKEEEKIEENEEEKKGIFTKLKEKFVKKEEGSE